MAQAARKAEVFEFPSGGIADFYMEDDEIAALEREEAKEQFGNKGIANFSDVATRMASYGRYGDDTVAHVETGELVIPKALIDENPKLRDSIFQHLEELGVEDPERYVVGSGANSINPDTGLPEFFNIGKIFKKIKKGVSNVAKGVKKAFKGVTKVIKKIAPIVLPIALSFTPLGAIYGAALGSGIGTLIQGGNLKDAFKSALVAGATGAVFKGLGNKLSGQGTFMEGVSKAAANPMGRITQTASGLGSTLGGGGFTGQGNLFSDFVPTPSAIDPASVPPSDMISTTASDQLAADTATDFTGQKVEFPDAQNYSTRATDGSTDFLGGQSTAPANQSMSNYNAQTGKFDLGNTQINTPPVERTFLEKTQDYLIRGGQSPDAIAGAQAAAEQKAIQNTLLKYGHQGPLTTAPATIASKAIAAGEAAAAAAGPGILAKFGPSAALAGTAAYAGGFFDAPEEPPQEELQTGTDLIALNPDEYLLPEETPQYAQGPTVVGTNYGINPNTGRPYVNPFVRPNYARPLYAAEGGEIFPRRVGGIMPNEGTPGKDSVRAMLMPGEFVMTTDAVKGLGNGNNDRGINRMYDMMRGLEAKGRAMA